ncbi:2OG-Fe(II) oxygenase superfamily [seawater metagenome]|uniref:2OG-Fe(II) oxygenase superfamily n=1 Tax=seawater metagenome TaxID=1561972 RepID=A0A5E8CH45_9ZZZZ
MSHTYLDPLEQSWIKYYSNIPENVKINQTDFEILWNLHPEEKGKVKIMGKQLETPRWQQAYGISYSFSGTVNNALPIPPMIQKFIDWANLKEDSDDIFNMALVNWYLNGDHYIGHHSDDERQLIKESSIYCFSFGADRDFILKNKTTKENTKICLNDNSLIIMGGKCQKTHTHSIPKRKKINDRRISITLRKFKNIE